jgi:hypothetical protein
VTALGSSREDQRLLEESVRGILRRRNEWRGPEAAQRAIKEAEGDLRELEGELARVERDLRAFREAETHLHELSGGYSGTAAQIARKLSEQEQEFSWFPEVSADVPFPLDASDAAFLAEMHARVTAEIPSRGMVYFAGPASGRLIVYHAQSSSDAAGIGAGSVSPCNFRMDCWLK